MANKTGCVSLTAWTVLLFCVFLTACGTQPVSSTSFQKPSKPITSINVLYIESMLRNSNSNGSNQSGLLHGLGYFDIGDLIKAAGPAVLSRHGVTGAVDYLPAQSEGKVKFTEKSDGLLTLTFTGGQTRTYGGDEAKLTLIALLRNLDDNKIYWRGEYQVVVKKTPFGAVTFNEKLVTELLEKIFSDMGKHKLITPQTLIPLAS